mmetsp:Transcript_63681/g.105888  ORF Transcript_63681/g.105888 Transcript_63681/m.105888 type:complete len:119 (+) Transcript_63681:39-395(+)
MLGSQNSKAAGSRHKERDLMLYPPSMRQVPHSSTTQLTSYPANTSSVSSFQRESSVSLPALREVALQYLQQHPECQHLPLDLLARKLARRQQTHIFHSSGEPTRERCEVLSTPKWRAQ